MHLIADLTDAVCHSKFVFRGGLCRQFGLYTLIFHPYGPRVSVNFKSNVTWFGLQGKEELQAVHSVQN